MFMSVKGHNVKKLNKWIDEKILQKKKKTQQKLEEVS